MKLTNQILGIGLAAVVGFASASFADDTSVKGHKSLEQRIAELEAKLKDAGVSGGVKGSGIKISGYVDTSYLVNLGDRTNTGPVAGSSNRNTGRVFDNQMNSFNINAFKLTIQKDKDNSKFPAGFRTDLIYGSDATVLNSTNPHNGGGLVAFNESAIFLEQAYVDLGIPVGNGIDVKFGKMVSLMGYEVIESPANWQFSRSDGFRLAPNTQIGATFGYQWNDMVTTTVGVVNGLNSTARFAGGDSIASNTVTGSGAGNFNRSLAFVGRVDVNGPKTSFGNFNAFAAGFYGNGDSTTTNPGGPGAAAPTGVNASNDQQNYLWEVGGVWDRPFGLKPMALGLDYLYRYDRVSIIGTTGGASLQASALSAYGKWDWSKWLTTSGRFSYSWYNNPSTSVATAPGGGGTASLGPLIVPTGGFQPNYTDNLSFTLTQAFNVWKDTLVRLEWRRDWTSMSTRSAGFGTEFGAAAAGGSNNDIRQSQDTIALNVVYSF